MPVVSSRGIVELLGCWVRGGFVIRDGRAIFPKVNVDWRLMALLLLVDIVNEVSVNLLTGQISFPNSPRDVHFSLTLFRTQRLYIRKELD